MVHEHALDHTTRFWQRLRLVLRMQMPAHPPARSLTCRVSHKLYLLPGPPAACSQGMHGLRSTTSGALTGCSWSAATATSSSSRMTCCSALTS